MDDKSRNEMALFKFSLIAPLVNGSATGKTKDYLENICAKTYPMPDGNFKELSPNTVRRWLSEYRRFGLDGLKRKSRNDKGASRALTPEIVQSIKELKSLYPHKTATTIYSELLSGGFLGSPPVSIATVQRFLRKFEIKTSPDIERKRFVFELANDCWQTDVLVGPYLLIDGKKKCTYLIAFLDDASRLLLHGEFFFVENAVSLQTVLKKAILKRGIPKRIFTDNGKIFISLQLRLICASLGIVLSHSRPYSPASKGKIERVFRTFRMQFLDSLDFAEVTSLAELNSRFLNYAESIYNLKPHSSLNGLSPMERYLKDQSFFRFVSSKALLEQVFLHELVRKVNNDATIVLFKQVYEVPQNLIGQSVTIRFDPEDLAKVFLKTGQPEVLVPVYPVQAIDNSRMIRKQNQKQEIDFATLYGAGVQP
jgi:transposase InsO family protein